MGLDRCQIIRYSGLSDGVYTSYSSYSCYCFYTWAAQLIRGVCNLDISFICWFKVIFSTAEEVGGVEDKGSGDTTTIDVHTLLEAFLNMSLRSSCFINEALSNKQQTFWSWNYSPQALDYQDSWISRCHISKILMLWMQSFCKNYSSKIWIWSLKESQHLVMQVCCLRTQVMPH